MNDSDAKAQLMADTAWKLLETLGETDGMLSPAQQAEIIAWILARAAASQPEPLNAFKAVARMLAEDFASCMTDPGYMARHRERTTIVPDGKSN
jgi:hypothetical protein